MTSHESALSGVARDAASLSRCGHTRKCPPGRQHGIAGAVLKRPRPDYKRWLALCGPAILIFAVLYVTPLLQLVRLSFDRFDPSSGVIPDFQLGFYVRFLTDSYYLGILWRTLSISLITTVACAILAYPLAAFLISSRKWQQTGLFIVLLMPLVTSSIVVSYGWLILLGQQGLVNRVVLALGLSQTPLRMMYSRAGIVIGLTHVLLVFMTLSIATSMQAIDPNLRKAARGLGATAWTTFRKVTLPLTLPGLRTGSLLVFSLAMSAYAIPVLIGGPRMKVLSYLIYQQSSSLLNWPFASAMAVILVISTGGVLAIAKAWGHLREIRRRSALGVAAQQPT